MLEFIAEFITPRSMLELVCVVLATSRGCYLIIN